MDTAIGEPVLVTWNIFLTLKKSINTLSNNAILLFSTKFYDDQGWLLALLIFGQSKPDPGI